MNRIKSYWPELCMLLVLVALGPLLVLEAQHLWSRTHFQFFPIAWIAFAYLVYRSGAPTWTSSSGRIWTASIAVAAAVCSMGLGAYRGSPWMFHASAIFWIAAWGLLRLDSVPTPRWLGWTLLLWITLPLPLGYDSELVQRLQAISSESAGSLLDLIGTPHLRLGNLFEVRPKKLFVDEACSGVDSLYSLSAVTILIILLQRKPFVVGFLALLSVPAWAWLGNVVRLTLIAWLLDTYGIDLSEGTAHTILGLVIFAATALCLLSLIQSLGLLFVRFSSGAVPRENRGWHLAYNRLVCWPGKAPEFKTEEDVFFAKEQKKKPLIEKPKLAPLPFPEWKILGRPALWLVPLFAMLGVGIGAINGGLMLKRQAVESSVALPHFDEAIVESQITINDMPEKMSGSTRTGFGGQHRSLNDFFGEYSRIWQYQNGESVAMLSLDFPFRGFHPLWVCYQNSGNTVIGVPEAMTVSAAGSNDWHVDLVELRSETGEMSYLWFTMFEGNGKPIELGKYKSGLDDRVAERLITPDYASAPVTYQYQLYIQTGDKISAEQKKDMFELFKAGLPYAVEAVKKISAENLR